jgi:hypothetical protein
VGGALVNLSRRGGVFVIFLLGAFLVFIMFFRLVLSTIHMCKTFYQKIKVNRTINSRKSDVFDKLPIQEQKSDSVFDVYYDEDGNDFRIKADDPIVKKFLGKLSKKSAINSQDIYRGFNVNELVEEQKLANDGKEVPKPPERANSLNLKKIMFAQVMKENFELKKNTVQKKESQILEEAKLEEKPSDEDMDDNEYNPEDFSEISSPSPELHKRKLGIGFKYENGLVNIERSYTNNMLNQEALLRRLTTENVHIASKDVHRKKHQSPTLTQETGQGDSSERSEYSSEGEEDESDQEESGETGRTESQEEDATSTISEVSESRELSYSTQ